MATSEAADERAMVSEKLAPVLLTTKSLTAFDLVVIFVGIVLFITNSAGLAPVHLFGLRRSPAHLAHRGSSAGWV